MTSTAAGRTERCPRCNSKSPHMHPAVQPEGEVEICIDDFHLTPTNQNTPTYIGAVLDRRAALAAAKTGGA